MARTSTAQEWATIFGYCNALWNCECCKYEKQKFEQTHGNGQPRLRPIMCCAANVGKGLATAKRTLIMAKVSFLRLWQSSRAGRAQDAASARRRGDRMNGRNVRFCPLADIRVLAANV